MKHLDQSSLSPQDNSVQFPNISSELINRIEEFKKSWEQHYKTVSAKKTKHKAKQRVVGRTSDGREIKEDYLPEDFMRSALNRYFPGWELRAIDTTVIAGKVVYFIGELIIPDPWLFHYLVMCGVPPDRARYERRYPAVGAAQINISSSTGNIINPAHPFKIAVTEALKYAINRLTGFGDDVYRKDSQSDVGITQEEYIKLSKVILESKMSQDDKLKALERLRVLNRANVKRFLEIIKQKEESNDDLS